MLGDYIVIAARGEYSLDWTNPFSTILPVARPTAKNGFACPGPDNLIARMSAFLTNAINTALAYMNDTPSVAVVPPNEEGWEVATLTWADGPNGAVKQFKFEILINREEGQTLACTLERDNVTVAWSERFQTALYNAIDGRSLDTHQLSQMPALEDMEDYSDMPPLET